ASCELTREGDLRISFLRGTFSDKPTTRRAAHNAALAINDIQADAIESFLRPCDALAPAARTRKCPHQIRILLEGVEDNLQFVEMVRHELQRINPAAARRVSA